MPHPPARWILLLATLCSFGCLPADEVTENATQNAINATEQSLDPRIVQLEEAVQQLGAELSTTKKQLEALEREVNDQEAQLDELIGDGDSPCWILEDTTLRVPGDHGTPAEAVAAAHRCRIWSDVTLTIAIDPGTYELDAPLTFAHPDGERLVVSGVGVDDSEVTLHFPASAGVVIPAGHVLGGLGGLTLTGDQAASALHAGVELRRSSLTISPSLTVSNFSGYGLWANRADVHADALTVTGNGRDGVQLRNNSTLVTASGGLTTIGNGRRGVYALIGSTAEVPGLTSQDDPVGIFGQLDGVISANNAEIRNSEVGVWASTGSTLFSSGLNVDSADIGARLDTGSTAELVNVDIANSQNSGARLRTGSTLYMQGDSRVTDTIDGPGVVVESGSSALFSNVDFLGNDAEAVIAFNGSAVQAVDVNYDDNSSGASVQIGSSYDDSNSRTSYSNYERFGVRLGVNSAARINGSFADSTVESGVEDATDSIWYRD